MTGLLGATATDNVVAVEKTDLSTTARFLVLSPRSAWVARAVRRDCLTYLTPGALRDLSLAVRLVERAHAAGAMVEAGTALGGSAIVMCSAKSTRRKLICYDMFGMIPPPSERDGADVHSRYDTIAEGRSNGIGGELYYGYREDLQQDVQTSFAKHGFPLEQNNVDLVAGPFDLTIPTDDPQPIALAHLDGDWYESTKTCLDGLAPRLVPRGRMIIDDYYAWSGCRTAVDEFLATHTGWTTERRHRLHLIRQ